MFLLRHGQSEFNQAMAETGRDPGLIDPPLTPLGEAQARAAGLSLAEQAITQILSSPYTRALQTASIVGAVLGVPVSVSSIVRERYNFTCDIGSSATTLARAWPALVFGPLPEVWWATEAEPAADVIARAALFRAEAAAWPDAATTLVVSHWGFILSLTGINAANGVVLPFDPASPAPVVHEIIWHP